MACAKVATSSRLRSPYGEDEAAARRWGCNAQRPTTTTRASVMAADIVSERYRRHSTDHVNTLCTIGNSGALQKDPARVGDAVGGVC